MTLPTPIPATAYTEVLGYVVAWVLVVLGIARGLRRRRPVTLGEQGEELGSLRRCGGEGTH